MMIEELDTGQENYVAERLFECCCSNNWVKQMLASRPFGNLPGLERRAAEIWSHLTPADWLEAFAQHPKIGETSKVSQWSAQEQSGMSSAAIQTAARLAELNRVYFAKFGWIFIVCATGKSADEMLRLLESRLPNDPDAELGIAAAEQSKITLLRLRKLLA
jgi:OHCU decarboxylase